MASIFTYQEEPPRVHSPWSTPGHGTPQNGVSQVSLQNAPDGSYTTSVTRLEPERQEGPTEYKLHLLLRLRGSLPASGSLAKESRQARLQQLTTQLLWRLQQSSPFHSSSNANLVLPVLPDATPRLGVPDKPARLLPGLEESQGALYEIGVADDGTLVGLVDDEMEESLTNLRAMAASLGCVVDILRRVVVHQSEYQDSNDHLSIIPKKFRLSVAEVLVRPDTRSSRVPPLEESTVSTAFSTHTYDHTFPVDESSTPQMRIAFMGTSTAGKSSLVGTLTSSKLDNGRGKSRLALLKHRHEIASGVTSSVAQELIGYRDNDLKLDEFSVINYASGDVSSWPDIHGLSNRLIFLSDSPGLPRYAKSTFRTLVSWDPHWTLLCVPADENGFEKVQVGALDTTPAITSHATNGNGQEGNDVSLAHLEICLKLNKRMLIVVTKMDLATKSGLKATLSKILSALKQAGKIPILLSAPSNCNINPDEGTDMSSQLSELTPTEQKQTRAVLDNMKDDCDNKNVPIVLTSAVTGAGIGKLHTLLRTLPIKTNQPAPISKRTSILSTTSIFHVDETFAIPPSRVYSATKKEHTADHGIVLCGHVSSGKLSVGDHLRLGPFWLDLESTQGESGDGTPRSTTYAADNGRRPLPRALSGELSKSLQGERIRLSGAMFENTSAFIDVSVVSLRSLRLPVRSMHAGETGTVGVQPVDQTTTIPLSRARKGMILSSQLISDLAGYKMFTATFPSSDFASMDSAPLILGGHAIVYINSIRAAVRVIAVRLDDNDDSDSSSPTELFSFDAESSAASPIVRITFKFISSIERLEIGDQVLIIPTTTAAGPVSGPSTNAVAGLCGFVGRIAEAS